MRAFLLASAALLAAPLATAQTSTSSQYELRGSYAGATLDVGQADDVSGSAVAGGNMVSRSSRHGDANVVAYQRMDGDANAQAVANVDDAGTIETGAETVANGATISAANGNMDADVTQLAHGESNAETLVNARDAWQSATSASASGNVAALTALNGDLRGNITQESTGQVTAAVESNHGAVWDQTSASALASANNSTATGTTTTLLTNTNQTASGPYVGAQVELRADHAESAVGSAVANANSNVIDNAWGYVNAAARQQASADVRADSTVTLDSGFSGAASASGVGNQTIASTSASDTVLDITQENSGAIDANATVNGGEQASASSAAYGNVISGSLCTQCGGQGSLDATSSQYNEGPVTSTARVNADRARSVSASASAIGNAASYEVRSAD